MEMIISEQRQEIRNLLFEETKKMTSLSYDCESEREAAA